MLLNSNADLAPACLDSADALLLPDNLTCGLQSFFNPDIGNISCPVLTTRGTQDNILGNQEFAFYDQLNPKTQALSQVVVFNASSGGALHDQVKHSATLLQPLHTCNSLYNVSVQCCLVISS